MRSFGFRDSAIEGGKSRVAGIVASQIIHAFFPNFRFLSEDDLNIMGLASCQLNPKFKNTLPPRVRGPVSGGQSLPQISFGRAVPVEERVCRIP